MELKQTDPFINGEGGYHTYRIPGLAVSTQGTVLAFCEGRKYSAKDASPTALVLRRSFDGGTTWQPLQLVVDEVRAALMNPCPVVVRKTGEIVFIYNRYPPDHTENTVEPGLSGLTCTTWMTKSTNDGATWTTPVNITKTTKKPEWTSVTAGEGLGIQMRSGRLVVSCNHGPQPWQSFVIYSDDQGQSWCLGGETDVNTNESQVVELTDGSLMLNMRSYRGKNCRAIAISSDGGLTWSEVYDDHVLIEPICQASLIRYTDVHSDKKNRLLFSNPASTTDRVNMTIRLSYDEGESWPVAKQLYAGPSAYSCLTVLSDMIIGCLYERGNSHPYEKITFARFDCEWLTDGTDSLSG